MQGTVDRSDIYKSVESSLDRLLAEHLGHVEATIREIRRAEVGADAAAEEWKRGNKTDEEYAAEAAMRRVAREEQKKKDEARKRREEEKEMLRAEEAKKKAELERLRRREERRKEEAAKKASQAKDREANRALLRKAEEENERRRQERRERHAREELERNALKEPSHERVQSAHREPESIAPVQDALMPDAASPETPSVPPIDDKDLEAIALERLLNEGRELAAKAGSSLNFERSEPLDPASLRKSQSVKGLPSPPKGPASDRINSPLSFEPPKGPRLSYSKSNRPTYSPHPPETQRRSRSPSRQPYHATPSRDSPDLRRTNDSEAKAAWKKQAVARRDDEGEYYKASTPREKSATREREDEYRYRAYHEEGEHPKGPPQVYYEERSREGERYKERDYKDPDHYRERKRDYRPSRHDRSRSREHRERGREIYRDRESRSHRVRDHDRDRDRSTRYEDPHRDRERRSRSPTARSSHHIPYDKSSIDTRSSRPSDRPRPKSPVEIDRYVPSTSARARDPERHRQGHDGADERDRERERPTTRDGHKEVEQEGERPSTRDAYKERERLAPKDGNKVVDDHRERERPATRDGYKERDKERERPPTRDDYRDRERVRERDRHGERLQDKERDRDRHGDRDSREKKGYVEIDRYVPGGSSRAKELEYPRARDGERDRDRERERPRERERERE